MTETWTISWMIGTGVVQAAASLGRAFPAEVPGSLLSPLPPGDSSFCSPHFLFIFTSPRTGKHPPHTPLPRKITPKKVLKHRGQFSSSPTSEPVPTMRTLHHNRNCDRFLLFDYKSVQQVLIIRWRLSYASSFAFLGSHRDACEELHVFLSICNSHDDSEGRCHYCRCFEQVRKSRLTEIKHLSEGRTASRQRAAVGFQSHRSSSLLPRIPSGSTILSILMSSFALF